MRVVAEPEHNDCKITIISWNQKYIVKYERDGLEQIYKIAEIDTCGLDEVQSAVVDKNFIQQVIQRFDDMHLGWNKVFEF